MQLFCAVKIPRETLQSTTTIILVCYVCVVLPNMNHVWSRRTYQWAWPHPVRCVRCAAAVGATEEEGDGENCFCVAFLQCVWPLTSLLCTPRLAFQIEDFLQYAKGFWGSPVLRPVSVYLRLTSETLQKTLWNAVAATTDSFFIARRSTETRACLNRATTQVFGAKGNQKDPFGVAASLAR